MKQHRTMLACRDCGKLFYGSQDNYYCPDCAKLRKAESTVRTRVCCDCGKKFLGGPRARRCPSCADIAKRNYKHKRTERPLGSIDKCVICGKEYVVVSGRQKYCSLECQRIGTLAWQREHKKGYNVVYGQNERRAKRRAGKEKVCIYCLKRFQTDTNTNLCSEYCRKENKKISQCKTDIARGRKRDINKYIEKREEYRRKVNEGQHI